MSTAFKKGDKITILSSWDNKGTVSFTNGVVYSCGKRQMVITNESTGEEIGRHFTPVAGSLDNVQSFNFAGVFPRMTEDEAVQMCLEIGALVIEAVKVDVEYRLTLPAYSVEGQTRRLAELHEPRALDRRTV